MKSTGVTAMKLLRLCFHRYLTLSGLVQLLIITNIYGNEISFSTHPIVENFRQSIRVESGDLDGDGDTDLIAASFDEGQIMWFENRLNESENLDSAWLLHVIDTQVLDFNTALLVQDIDLDQDLDIMLASQSVGGLLVYENDGLELPSMKSHTIEVQRSEIHSIDIADIDGDSDPDLLIAFSGFSSSASNDRIAWYENKGSIDSEWIHHTILDGSGSVTSSSNQLYPADFNGDNKLDFLFKTVSSLSWFENITDGSSVPSWKEHPVDTNLWSGPKGRVFDADSDGDADFLIWDMFGGFLLYENQSNIPSSNQESHWHKRTLTSQKPGNAEIVPFATGDIDLDGHVDVLAILENKFLLIINPGNNDYWDADYIHPSPNYYVSVVHDTSLIDLDGDDDLDYVFFEMFQQNFLWLENKYHLPEEPIPFLLPLVQGWNFVSIPISLPEQSPIKLFGEDIRIWEYDNETSTYMIPEKIENHKGYIIYSTAPEEYHLIGTARHNEPLSINNGWNMIGVNQETVLQNRGIISLWEQDSLTNELRLLSPGTRLQPGKGYWIHTRERVTLFNGNDGNWLYPLYPLYHFEFKVSVSGSPLQTLNLGWDNSATDEYGEEDLSPPPDVPDAQGTVSLLLHQGQNTVHVVRDYRSIAESGKWIMQMNQRAGAAISLTWNTNLFWLREAKLVEIRPQDGLPVPHAEEISLINQSSLTIEAPQNDSERWFEILLRRDRELTEVQDWHVWIPDNDSGSPIVD
jgi:hypothetical protein